eukprot:3783100-Prymnesium_polylepis.1
MPMMPRAVPIDSVHKPSEQRTHAHSNDTHASTAVAQGLAACAICFCARAQLVPCRTGRAGVRP